MAKASVASRMMQPTACGASHNHQPAPIKAISRGGDSWIDAPSGRRQISTPAKPNSSSDVANRQPKSPCDANG